MNTELLKVSIRQNAIFMPGPVEVQTETPEFYDTTATLVANCAKLGFSFSEPLLAAINKATPSKKLAVLQVLKEITNVGKNWTPLVKKWNIPTGESIVDHFITFFANALHSKKGTTLACGHLIPDNTFPLDRYNGCPYCGTPFEFEKLEYSAGTNKLKVLELWSETDLQNHFKGLLESSVALDATQIDSLKIMLAHYPIPAEVNIAIKETTMVVIDAYVDQKESEKAGAFFKTPTDILRYLWYKNTGFLQIIEPKTIINRLSKNSTNIHAKLDKSSVAKLKAVADLKLKFTRPECRQYAQWINNLPMDIQAQCENMHPKRNMWVRVIRALRLAEYSKKPGFNNLKELLDVFYNEKYEVWQAKVNHFRLKNDAQNTFHLLKQRPGLFARSLFSSMLWFGKDVTLAHFREIMHTLPPRLIYTLNMYAEIYFDKKATRSVKPLGGANKKITANPLVELFDDAELADMQKMVKGLSLEVIKRRFEQEENTNKTIYIDQGLFNIPMAIGDRSETVQDLPSALMGTVFPVEGDTVRLFMQWGEGLPAQHLDMDLSCRISYDGKSDYCSYSSLTIRGCKHSGDIQRIPALVGTAEYIDINVEELAKAGAGYAMFTCNAYSNGEIIPNLLVGWMNSKYPMKITKNGVAYEPSAVQHQIRITQGLSKGMVFGILDIQKREIIWLEMSFAGQVIQGLDTKGVEAFLHKLKAKLKIGDLLRLKAEVQGLQETSDSALADEVYDLKWATDIGEVNAVLLE